tara:strand:+ start:354 stop:572 length:219 start_codon:yes stop_codon:yes gene_type:complete
MEIRQYKDGSGEIIFSKEEIKIIRERGNLKLTSEGLRHFGNNLVKIVAEFQLNFDEKVKNMSSQVGDDIETS